MLAPFWYDILVPKANTLLVLLFFIPTYTSTLQYSPIDTLNSKIHPPVLIIWDMEEYCLPHYDIYVPKANTITYNIFLPAYKSTIQYGHIDTLNTKIHPLIIILWDMEEYCWSHYDIPVPKANTLLVILFFVLASKSTLQYGRIDTLNSKIHPQVIILSQNRDEQKYLAPHLHFHTKMK